MWSDLTKVKQGYPNLNMLIAHLLLVLEVCNVKPTYRKSLAGNLLMWSDLSLGPSFEVVSSALPTTRRDMTCTVLKATLSPK